MVVRSGRLNTLKEKLQILPNSPGCYLMLDKNNTIIYIGKAKNLKNRIKSYFSGAHNLKTQKLVSEIADFSYFQTKSELEALLLEINLIKEHLPKYNIKLTDDASYPYIVITNEEHPKVMVSRDLDPKKGTYFGPYPNVYSARETVKLINKMYPLRKCDTIPKQACLYYHMGECLAPCISKEPIDYSPYIKEITDFLKGDNKKVLNKLKDKMLEASERLQFERALEFKKLMDSITTTTEKQLISLNDFKDRDFIAYKADTDEISIQILIMRTGKIVDTKNIIIDRLINPNDQVMSYLLQYYDKHMMPDEICFMDAFNIDELKEVFKNKAVIPKIGDKKKLIDLAYENASYELLHKQRLKENRLRQKTIKEEIFKDLLGLEQVKRIEAFDNAHLFGADPISALVVYKSGKPLKKEYRKYHLKHTKKGDDYGAFKEVLYRRYQRVLVEGLEKPDLIIVDGGKGQVSTATQTLSELSLEIPIIGLKKNHRHQLESVIYLNKEYMLEKATPLALFLAEISEETHRFAITFHKSTRKRSSFTSFLDGIKGVGPVTKQKLLQKFVTIEKMIEGSVSDYEEIKINETLREKIIAHLEERRKDEKAN